MKAGRALLVVAAAVLLAVENGSAQGTLTLGEAAARALRRNPELQLDAPARAAAAAEIAAARAGFMPRVDVEASYGGGNNPVYVFGTLLTQRRFGASNFALDALNTPDPIDNLQTRVLVQQNLWDFGRTQHHLASARIAVEISDYGHEDNVRRTLLAVVEAYWGVSLAREAWDAARAALESAEAITAQARARVDAGVAVEADLLRAEVQLAVARRQEIEARTEMDVARAALQRSLGETFDAPLGETAPLDDARFPVPALEDVLSRQRELRPDYLRKRAELRQAEADAAGRRADLRPILSAYAAVENDAPSLRAGGGGNWIAGLALRWNLSSGGAGGARLDAARQRLELKKREVAALESRMELEARRALARHRSAELQVVVTRAAEAQSIEGLRILRNRYEAGLATLTDVLSAEGARAAARIALAQTIYRQRLAFAELESVAGTLVPGSAALRP